MHLRTGLLIKPTTKELAFSDLQEYFRHLCLPARTGESGTDGVTEAD